MSRYARLFVLQLRMSAVTAMQYRSDFLMKGAMAFVWLGVTLVPLISVFHHRDTVRGWSFPEALVVLACFSMMKGILEGAISPSLTSVVEHVRKGTLDFLLLKPVDAQFLVSTAKIEPWKVMDLLGGLGVAVFAFHRLGHVPAPGAVAIALALMAVGVLVLYALWILVVSAAFWVVKVDNLSYLFGSLFDAGRWPIAVFRGALWFAFTFVFPLALMTSYPAMALLDRLSASTALAAAGGGLAFASVARFVWRRALGFYTSASS
ncbi:MAG TPA: ABC-2 family transporter protein [Polyangia bacterium]|nr:ABC-2 family transporter protein [Polyangia bacterium]